MFGTSWETEGKKITRRVFFTPLICIYLFIYLLAESAARVQLISHNLFAARWVLENDTSWACKKALKKNNPKATLAIKHVTP